MRVLSFGKSVIQLTKFPRFFPVNCYLVREDDGFTLIDTAIGGCAPAILAAAKTQGMPIKRIVLTHGHGDHVGSLDALRAALPDAEVLVGAREARLLAGDMSLEAGEPQTKIGGMWQKITTRPTRLLLHGEHVGSLEVVASPGHTPGHLSFIDTRDRTLIAGDAFQTRAGVAVSGTVKLLFPFPALATWNKPVALESARVLRALNPSRLAVGHGEVVEQPLDVIDAAIAEAAKAIAQVLHGA